MKITSHGTYHHYRKNEKGELIDMGEVHYSYKEQVVTDRQAKRQWISEAELRDYEIAKATRERDAFEEWVDAACEMEDSYDRS